MKFFTRFNWKKVSTPVEGESLTRQEFKDDCDVNNIIKKYQATGVLVDPLKVNRRRVPQFLDVSAVPDLQTAYNIISDATDRFNALPGDVRAKVGNDPMAFVSWLTDPANREEAIEAGLLVDYSQAAKAAVPEPVATATEPAKDPTGSVEDPK